MKENTDKAETVKQKNGNKYKQVLANHTNPKLLKRVNPVRKDWPIRASDPRPAPDPMYLRRFRTQSIDDAGGIFRCCTGASGPSPSLEPLYIAWAASAWDSQKTDTIFNCRNFPNEVWFRWVSSPRNVVNQREASRYCSVELDPLSPQGALRG